VVVLWRISERCNLGCAFCGYSRELRRTRRETDAGEIRRVIGLLAEYRRRTRSRVLLSWLGGEPFLRGDLVELGRLAHGAGLLLSATTNGSALGSPRLRRHLVDCYAELTVSIDGRGPFHDRVRGWPGGFRQLSASLRSLAAERNAANSRLLLRVNTVLMHDNVRALPELAHELARWGVDELSFNQLGGAERPEFHAQQRLTAEDAAWLAERVPRLRGELAARGLRLLGGSRYLARIRATARAEALPIADCAPGEAFVFIDEEGMVSPCSFTSSDYGIRLSEIKSEREIESLPQRYRTARARRRASACGDCHSTQTFAKFAGPS
jgi:MoaA/NifB/PqqE/SkfB family radical SAM enzyme